MFFAGISDEAAASIEQQIAAHRLLGWAHLELRGIDGVNLTTVSDEAFAHVVEAVEAAGMTVCCFASEVANGRRSIDGDFAIDVAELRRAIPRMHRLGTKYLRCMSWPNKGDVLAQDAWRDEAVRRLRELARMAEDGGITLLHENCSGWGGQSPAHTLELLERVDSPAMKLVFDPGNTMARGNALAFLRQVIDHVVHVHIKDGCPDGDRKGHTYPGEGCCEVEECVRLLIERGYDGGYSIEPHIAGVIQAREGLNRELPAVKWDSYLEYGRRFVTLYQRVAAEKTVTV